VGRRIGDTSLSSSAATAADIKDFDDAQMTGVMKHRTETESGEEELRDAGRFTHAGGNRREREREKRGRGS
jgi:hypothetical protein